MNKLIELNKAREAVSLKWCIDLINRLIDIEILTQAKELVKSDKQEFICNAIKIVCDPVKEQVGDRCTFLIGWIETMLGKPGDAYNSWLHTNYPDAIDEIRPNSLYKQERCNWIDWMIKETLRLP